MTELQQCIQYDYSGLNLSSQGDINADNAHATLIYSDDMFSVRYARH
jgi:hypothetical protein